MPEIFRVNTKLIVRLEWPYDKYIKPHYRYAHIFKRLVKAIESKNKRIPPVCVMPITVENLIHAINNKDVHQWAKRTLNRRISKKAKWFLTDGHHRLTAHEYCGRTYIKARIADPFGFFGKKIY